jgi:hypothetical protein
VSWQEIAMQREERLKGRLDDFREAVQQLVNAHLDDGVVPVEKLMGLLGRDQVTGSALGVREDPED